MKLAIMNSWPNVPLCAEKEFILRSLISLQELGWEAAEVVTSDDIERFSPECVLVTHEFSPKLTAVPTLGLMWSPLAFFYNDPVRIRSLLSYDGFLAGSKGIASYLKDLLYSTGKNAPISDFPFLPTCYRTEISGRLPDRRTLFYAGVGWDGQRHGSLFQALQGNVDMAFYGPPATWKQAGSQYRGQIAMDGRSVVEKIRESGVALCIHKTEHRIEGVPSMRLFEAAAAGAVILTDRLTFTTEKFGDTVLYLDFDQSPEAIANQVKEHMAWIERNPRQAEEKALAAHAIFNRDFCLEEQFQRLPAFLKKVRDAGRFDAPAAIADVAPAGEAHPQVEYIVRVGSRPVTTIDRCLDSLAKQTYKNLGVILVQFKSIEGFDELVDRYRKVFSSVKVVSAPPGVRSAAYWAGLNAVTAPYFGNCDDDDVLAPNHVATVLETLWKQPGVAFAYSGAIQVEEEPGHYTKLPNFNGATANEIPENRSLRFFDPFDVDRLMKIDNYINSNSWIARRELLDARLLQDPGMHCGEDFFLLLGFLTKTDFAFTWRPTAQWNWRSTSQDNSAFKPMLNNCVDRLPLLFRFHRWRHPGHNREIAIQFASVEETMNRRLAELEAKAAAMEFQILQNASLLSHRILRMETIVDKLRGIKRAVLEPTQWSKRLWRTCRSIGRESFKGAALGSAEIARDEAEPKTGTRGPR